MVRRITKMYGLRAVAVFLGAMHLLPAVKHVMKAIAEPTWPDLWRGLGAVLAVGVWLAPPRYQSRIGRLTARHIWVFFGVFALLVIAHAIAFAEHFPAFIARPNYSDGWRALGTGVAVVLFLRRMFRNRKTTKSDECGTPDERNEYDTGPDTSA